MAGSGGGHHSPMSSETESAQSKPEQELYWKRVRDGYEQFMAMFIALYIVLIVGLKHATSLSYYVAFLFGLAFGILAVIIMSCAQHIHKADRARAGCT